MGGGVAEECAEGLGSDDAVGCEAVLGLEGADGGECLGSEDAVGGEVVTGVLEVELEFADDFAAIAEGGVASAGDFDLEDGGGGAVVAEGDVDWLGVSGVAEAGEEGDGEEDAHGRPRSLRI